MVLPTLGRAELVGRGFCADVYAWGAGRVLKLFNGLAAPEREFAATRAVRSAGLPAPAAYEVIEVEGRHGIVFERIDGVSLFDHTQARPWKLFAPIRLAAAGDPPGFSRFSFRETARACEPVGEPLFPEDRP